MVMCFFVRCGVLSHWSDLHVYASIPNFSGLVKFFKQVDSSKGASAVDTIASTFLRLTCWRISRLKSTIGSSETVTFLHDRQVIVLRSLP